MKLFGFEFGKQEPKTTSDLREDNVHAFHWHRRGLGTNDNSNGLTSFHEQKSGKWIMFGRDNRFPNYLNDLVNSSGLHGAIVNFKKTMISGAGYEVKSIVPLDAVKEVQVKQFTMRPNSYQTLEELMDGLTVDYIVHGTVYLKVYWNSDHTKPLKLERIEPSRIRVGYNRAEPDHPTRYFYCTDWDRQGEYPITEYPAYDTSKKESVQIYRYTIPNSALVYNTFPSYVSALNWIQLDGEISLYQKSNIENSLNPSMAIKFYQRPANDEEKRKIVSGIEKHFKGSHNTGRAMIFFSDDKDTAPDINPIATSALDKQFATTAEQISRQICYSHGINPTLVGIKTPGSLGGASEIGPSYEVFKKTYVEPAQRDLEQVINKFAKMMVGVTIKLNEAEINYTEL